AAAPEGVRGYLVAGVLAWPLLLSPVGSFPAVGKEGDAVMVLSPVWWLEPVVAVVTVRVPVVVVAAQLTVKLVVAVPPEGTFAVWGLALVTVQLAAAPESVTW